MIYSKCGKVEMWNFFTSAVNTGKVIITWLTGTLIECQNIVCLYKYCVNCCLLVGLLEIFYLLTLYLSSTNLLLLFYYIESRCGAVPVRVARNSHEGQQLFPYWEWNVPTLGMFYSQAGNKYRAWRRANGYPYCGIRYPYCRIRCPYCRIRYPYCRIRNTYLACRVMVEDR